MDVFEIRNRLINEYKAFTRSFTKIRAQDILEVVDSAYQDERFYPQPLIQMNPNFSPGGSIDELVEQGLLHEECKRIFRLKSQDDASGKPLVLHQHQVDAIHAARRQESYVITTGTGSGKSLGYFIPIVDFVLRRSKSDRRGISAIVVYPMNALCNSQLLELEKYLKLGYGDGDSPVTFARYTGQETTAAREKLASNPPDILLTNYVMLELLMTRFWSADVAVRNHAKGLPFLVLDELHTYRGRSGADVSMLVRRVRERFNSDLVCIGTSATMASEGESGARDSTVAGVASQIFGSTVMTKNVITETLSQVTTEGSYTNDRAILQAAMRAGVPTSLTYDELTEHPIAAWLEMNVGLEVRDGQLARQSRPLSVKESAEKLASASGNSADECEKYLTQLLMHAHSCKDEKGRSFFAFRLHQFISGAWNVYSTIDPPETRYTTLDGQQFVPQQDRSKRLFNLCFCRECGQEYFPVWAVKEAESTVKFDPRDLSASQNEESRDFGYLMPDPRSQFDPAGDLEGSYPNDWLDYSGNQVRVKKNLRERQPASSRVLPDGSIDSSGMQTWYIPGGFRFCLNSECDAEFDRFQRSEHTKLAGLSSEGRSSATTMLAMASLKLLAGSDLDDETKKLLAFTDNRQDASLQAGHFNDFVQILLLRSALLGAIKAQPNQRLTDSELANGVFEALGLEVAEYAENPKVLGKAATQASDTLRRVLGYRLYFDLQRGWRITNPNLEQLGALEISYDSLDDCCSDEDLWRETVSHLSGASVAQRTELCRDLLDLMRKQLCIWTRHLNGNELDSLKNTSFIHLNSRWGINREDSLTTARHMVPRSQSHAVRRNYRTHHVSHLSVFGKKVCSGAYWRNEPLVRGEKLDANGYNELIDSALDAMSRYGIIRREELTREIVGYQVSGGVLVWSIPESSNEPSSTVNEFFLNLYENLSEILGGNDRLFHQLTAREHTAQVASKDREEREEQFRRGLGSEGLPLLFCSPTMELGVDISSLNAVYMRNVPPTPANYTQRSGRAGRSGQPALVLTYCAAKSPHDQFFFGDPAKMVSGEVRPPSIELANEDLLRAHLHAEWLVETGCRLPEHITEIVDLEAKLELVPDIVAQISSDQAIQRTRMRGERLLKSISKELSATSAYWYTDTWLDGMLRSAKDSLDWSFKRWRDLYRALYQQRTSARQIIENVSASQNEHHAARRRFDEADNQLTGLLTNQQRNSDYGTYRYLASEGFLPGYNFPRLPMQALLPASRNASYRDPISRPRFVGLNEFGPRSVIYHEGNTYRVKGVVLTFDSEASDVVDVEALTKKEMNICPECGYAHEGEKLNYELCHNCGARLTGEYRLTSLLRIEQVRTEQAGRITSDEEERQRMGFETLTSFRIEGDADSAGFSQHKAKLGSTELASLTYVASARLSKVNLGWRGRKEESLYGFNIEVGSGAWQKNEQDQRDDLSSPDIDLERTDRVIPYVEDTKNILIFRPTDELSTTAFTTLRFALKRGIEQVFQLEESELGAEPLPDENNTETILFYEASEGGAGVLSRLVNDPKTIQRVCMQAFSIMHWELSAGTGPVKERLTDTDDTCEAGCYSCLLSYFNQRDHASIDRKGGEFLEYLDRLADCEVSRGDQGSHFEQLINGCVSELEKDWVRYIHNNGYRLPDVCNHYLEQLNTTPDFEYFDNQTAIYIDGPPHVKVGQASKDAEITERLENSGYTVIRFPHEKGTWPDLISQFGWVFGEGSSD